MGKLNLKNGSIEIKNQTSSKAELYFYGDIIADEWYRWTEDEQCPDSVKKFLDEVKDVKELDIFINSGGGSVFGGIAIYNMLKRNKAYKTVFVDALAASIASVIAMAGDKIIIPSNAYLMIHKASTGVWGNSNDFKKAIEKLETIEEGVLNIYKENLKEGVDINIIKQFMEEETWFTGEKAAEYFNIEVGKSLEAVACVSDLNAYEKAPPELNKVSNNTKIQNVNLSIDEIVAKVKENLKTETPKEPIKNTSSFFDLRKKLINI